MANSTILDLPDGIYEDIQGWSGMIRHPDIMSLTAGAYPTSPPFKWFDDPGFTTLTPLTIDDNGHVFGHIAAWHTSHIGMAGGVKPPRSKTDYAYYRTGVVKCDDGKFVDVGQITLTGGHAPLNAGVSRAVAHYDDTDSAIMDVAAGEDKHGIWVSGALRPDVTEEQLRSIRASSVSGDWRPINGKLELVAVCAVNAPGFPIPRARVASGAPIALVAAGIEPLIELAMNDRIEANVEEGIKSGLELFRTRILRLENVVLADCGPAQDKSDINPDQLRKRVRGGSALAASFRNRVRGTHSVEVVADVKSIAASLRERVKGADARPDTLEAESLGGDLLGGGGRGLPGIDRPDWDATLHPRGADGRFIEIGSWVRWLRQGFGSTRRGEVKDIIPDPNSKTKDGKITRALARVEFSDRDGGSTIYDVSFEELEKVAPPKGFTNIPDDDITDAEYPGDERGERKVVRRIAEKAIGNLIRDDERNEFDDDGTPGTEDGNDTMNQLNPSEVNEVEDALENAVNNVLNDAIPDDPTDNPTDEQLEAEEIINLDPADVNNNSNALSKGFVDTPYVPPSDEWDKTSDWFITLQNENTPISEAIVSELSPNAFESTSEWADALRLARSQYDGWVSSQLAQGPGATDPDVDISMGAYLEWLEDRGLRASIITDRSVISVDQLRGQVHGT